MFKTTTKNLKLLPILLLLGLLFNPNPNFIWGQQINHNLSNDLHICGTDTHTKFMSLEEQQKEAEFESLYKKAIQQKMADGTINQKSNGEIYTIPIVVHVIHDGSEIGTTRNRSEAEIVALIEESSQRFRHQQQGAPNFSNPNYGIDTEFELCLASTDPNGNYTNGIVRHYYPEYHVSTTGNLVPFADKIAWDPNQYINLFIFSYQGGFGAYFMGRYLALRYSSLSSITLVHEVGHYLNLRHTFYGSSCTNNDCLTDGDAVCDTPPKSSSAINACVGQNLCTTDDDDTSTNNPYRPVSLGGMGDQDDMVQNYMDYGHCRSSFTLGQKERMRLYYETYKMNSLYTSPACNPQTKPNLDVSIDNGIDLDIPCGGNSGSPAIGIENKGNTTITSLNIEVYLNGALIDTESWSGNLAAGEGSIVGLSNITFPDGRNNLEVRLTDPNGQASDGISTNNSTSEYFNIVQGGIELELTIVADQYVLFHNNRWELLDANGNILDEGSAHLDNLNTPGQTTVCADPGSCYTFVMYDDGGNGMCCTTSIEGSYILQHPDGTVLASGGEFAYTDETSFCLSDPCTAFGGDADNDGFCANVDCNDNDFYQGAPQTPGTACDDGNIATENDVIQSDNCTCSGTLICAGYAEKDFSETNLTHRFAGSASTTVSFGGLKEDVRFTISDISQTTGGNPSSRYIEEVTISYRNAAGNMVVHGTYTGSPSQVSVEIPGPLSEVTVSLADAYDGSSAAILSVTLNTVGYCDSSGGSSCTNAGNACNDGDVCTINDTYDSNCNCVGTFQDSDGDGICDANDTNNGGGSGGCVNTSFNFSSNPLSKSGSGSNATTLNFPNNSTDVSFSISNINKKISGKASRRYIEQVTVTYVDGTGATQTYGVYSGNNTSSVNVSISGEVQSVTISLEDIYDGSTTSNMSIDFSSVTACVENGNRLDNELHNISEMFISPNPAISMVQISFLSKYSLQAAIQISSVNGEVLNKQLMMTNEGLNHTQLDVSQLPNGIYFVAIQIKGEVKVLKLVKI